MEKTFDYFGLVRKSDNVEVYSSPECKCSENGFNFSEIKKNLNFYFDRVNGGIQQQMESSRLSEEQKKNLKFLDKSDYVVRYERLKELGCAQKVWWTEEAKDFLA